MKDQNSKASALRQAVENSVTPSTLNTYEKFLKGVSFEVTDEALAEYVRRRFEKDGLAPGTLSGVLKAVSFDAKRNGKPDPVGPFTKSAMASIRREGRSRGRGQAMGVQMDQVREVAKLAAADGTVIGLRDAALISVASDGLLRIAEISNMRVEDLSFEQVDKSARLQIRHSKTDQEGKDQPIQYIGPTTARYLDNWLKAAKISEGPVFRRVWLGCKRKSSTVGKQSMSIGAIGKIIRARCEAAGIEGARGHSLRVGMAQSLVAEGATLPELMIAGRWKNPTVAAHYVKRQMAEKGAVARVFYGQE